jgi:hypothetical protein
VSPEWLARIAVAQFVRRQAGMLVARGLRLRNPFSVMGNHPEQSQAEKAA